MKSIFELVEAKDEEIDYPIGVYLNKGEAVKAATSGCISTSMINNQGTLEVREREIGVAELGNTGKTVATITWNFDVDSAKCSCSEETLNHDNKQTK